MLALHKKLEHDPIHFDRIGLWPETRSPLSRAVGNWKQRRGIDGLARHLDLEEQMRAVGHAGAADPCQAFPALHHNVFRTRANGARWRVARNHSAELAGAGD